MISYYVLEIADLDTIYLFENEEVYNEAKLYLESEDIAMFSGRMDLITDFKAFRQTINRELLKGLNK